MKALTWRIGLAVAVLGLVAGTAGPARGGLIVNGDFETGNLTGWTAFVTPNGWNGNGQPQVVLFDTDGNGTTSLAAQFEVAQLNFQQGVYAGGGIYQQFTTTTTGDLNFSADIASIAPSSSGNGSNGLFELLFDGVVLASHDFGGSSNNQPLRSLLSATATGVAAGMHELRFRITRPFLGGVGNTPYQYIDNVVVNQTGLAPVPEPSTLASGLLGAAFAGGWWLRRRKHQAT